MLKIYLTDLSAYNKGFLHGEWISLPCEDIEEQLSKILRGGEALCFLECGYFEEHEEYFITDYEWEEVSIFEISEYENLSSLNEQLSTLESLNSSQLKIVRFLLSENYTDDIESAIEKLDVVVLREDTSLLDYSYELLDELYNLNSLPSIITNNIDYQGVTKDLEYEGRYIEVDGDLYEYIG